MSVLYDQHDQPITGSHPLAARQSFRNTRRNRVRGGTRGPIGSANSHRDSRSLEDQIRDCEHLARNDHLAQAVVKARSDFVIGDDPGFHARSGDKVWDKKIEKRFRHWCDRHCDLAGQMTLAMIASSVVNAFDTSGGMLACKIIDPAGQPRLQMVEAIRLRNPGGAQDSLTMTAGVELDEKTYRPQTYHIADWNDRGTDLTNQTRPVHAHDAWLLNNPRLLKPNQHRAEPGLISTIDRFETIDRATESTWTSYQLATFISLYVQRAAAQGTSITDQIAQSRVAAGEAISVQQAKDGGVWGPGTVLYGEPGDTITQIDPKHPSTAFEAMFFTEMMGICASLDLPLELALMRFTSNFAASRSAMSVGWRKIMVLQRAIITRLLTPVYYWWLSVEYDAGRISLPKGGDWQAHEWFLPSMPSLDPKAEAEADLLNLSGGTTLLKTVLRRRGHGDYDEYLAEFKEEKIKNTEAGLEYRQPVSENKSETVNAEKDPYELEPEN